LSEHLDQETRAAAAAAALLRRLAKVGPDTTPEEAAKLWANTSLQARADVSNEPSASRRDPHRHVGGAAELGERRDPILGKRGVKFDLGSNSVHEVVPYCEVYGRHPREFVFGRHAEMLPAADRFGFVGLHQEDPEEDDDSDGEEEAQEEDQDAKHEESAEHQEFYINDERCSEELLYTSGTAAWQLWQEESQQMAITA